MQPVVFKISDQTVADEHLCMKIASTIAAGGVIAVRSDALPASLLRDCRNEARSFFHERDEVKMSAYLPSRGIGYLPFGSESLAASSGGTRTTDLKESFNYRRGGDRQPWPTGLRRFRDLMMAVYDALERLSATTLSHVASGLGLEPQQFHKLLSPGSSVLRATYYPPVSGEREVNTRAGEHTDYGMLSLLLLDEDVPGFEVYREHAWQPIEAPPEGLVANVGDLLERCTNGYLPATVHRVVLPADLRQPARERLSLVFLQNTAFDTLVAPLPQLIPPGSRARYEAVIAGDYFKAKSRAARGGQEE